jgi:cytochrome c biogenesis protein ResB
MSILSGMNYNAENEETMQDYTPVPSGEYLAIATNSEDKETKDKQGSYLQIEWTIVDGLHSGRKLWSRLNLDNNNYTAVKLAKMELATICKATGVLTPNDSAEFHGIPVVLTVGVEKNKKTEEMQNRIKNYKPAKEPKKSSSKEAKPNSPPPWNRSKDGLPF